MQDTVPLPQAFALYTAVCARYDLKPKGPDYVEREMIEALLKTGERRAETGKNRLRREPLSGRRSPVSGISP